jgi:hypothetical protein
MSREQLLQELEETRHQLWSALDLLDASVEIYPGWHAHQIFAHIAGWEALVFDIFHAHIFHHAPKNHGYQGVDHANARFVTARSHASLLDVRLECEINRFAILTLLGKITDFSEQVAFPWGINTVTEFLQGAIEHERTHAEDILKLGNSGDHHA